MATPRPGESEPGASAAGDSGGRIDGWLSPGYVMALCHTEIRIYTVLIGQTVRIADNNPRRVGLTVAVGPRANAGADISVVPNVTVGIIGGATPGNPFTASLTSLYALVVQEWYALARGDGTIMVCDMMRSGGS